MQKKILIGFFGSILLGSLLVLFLTTYFSSKRTLAPSIQSQTTNGATPIRTAHVSYTNQRITIDGFYLCLIPKNQFLNSLPGCILGIEKSDGTAYAFADQYQQYLSPIGFTTGQHISVTGLLGHDPDLEGQYTIVGVLQTNR